MAMYSTNLTDYKIDFNNLTDSLELCSWLQFNYLEIKNHSIRFKFKYD